MNEVLIMMGSFFIVFLLSFLVIAFLLRGFFGAWLIVKGSANRKVLVMIRGMVTNYTKSGKIVGTTVRFKGSSKDDDKTIILAPECMYRFASVNCINYDEQTGSLLTPDYESLKDRDPNNPNKMDSLLKRCLYQPPVFDNKEKIIMVMLVIVVVGIIVLGYLQYQSYEIINNLATITPVPVV